MLFDFWEEGMKINLKLPSAVSSLSDTTHIVRPVMPLLPLHQDYLSHHQRGDEDEHHLCMHGLMTPVLHMQALMLHPAENRVEMEKTERKHEGSQGES